MISSFGFPSRGRGRTSSKCSRSTCDIALRRDMYDTRSKPRRQARILPTVQERSTLGRLRQAQVPRLVRCKQEAPAIGPRRYRADCSRGQYPVRRHCNDRRGRRPVEVGPDECTLERNRRTDAESAAARFANCHRTVRSLNALNGPNAIRSDR
jgi:hypothetical protein